MKNRFPLVLAFWLLALSMAPAETWQDVYDGLLRKYVREKRVRYAAWHGDAADRQALEGVVHAIAHADVSELSREEKFAFYLNAYNAWILKTVLDHYPVDSIKDAMFLVFRRDIITVGGEKMSFSELENDVLRKQFKDSRIHFAVNCASKSCPPLHDRAFKAETLDKTLKTLTEAFIQRNPEAFTLREGGREVVVSKIFDWYREDFEREAGSVLAYLAKHGAKGFPGGAELKFQRYDWSLNEAK